MIVPSVYLTVKLVIEKAGYYWTHVWMQNDSLPNDSMSMVSMVGITPLKSAIRGEELVHLDLRAQKNPG